MRAEEVKQISANNLQISANKIPPKEKNWTIDYRDACPLFDFGGILFADICKLFADICFTSSALISKNNYFFFIN